MPRILTSVIAFFGLALVTPAGLCAAPAVGEVFRDCARCPDMVVLPPGSFLMGSPESEAGRRNDEGPVRRVRFEKAFAIGVLEVTIEQWAACADEGGCDFYTLKSPSNLPANYLNWHDANRYTKWLSRYTGYRYRLPSEAEWEYAARAGTETRYWCGDDEQCLDEAAWHMRNSGGSTRPTGQLKPNAFGLYDVHGNVAEWVADCYKSRPVSADPDTPDHDPGCAGRVQKGGGWNNHGNDMRSAARGWLSANVQYYMFGFRVVRELD